MSRRKTHNKTNFILERISRHHGFSQDADIAHYYGVSESTVSSWRVRDKINETLIRAKARDENLANWFLFGEKGDEIRGAPGSADAGENPVGPDPRYAQMIEDVALIMNSDFGGIKDALHQNIREFAQAVRDRSEIESLKEAQERDHVTIQALADKVKQMEIYIKKINDPEENTAAGEGG